MKTKPTKFKSAKQLIELWQEFCDEIVEAEFYTIPSQTSFCKWLTVHYEGADRKTIYNSLNKIFPDIKKDFEAIRADVIAEGSMLGKYNSTMSIFALKNWCKWTDKQEVTQFTADDVKQDALSQSLEAMAEDLESDD